MFDANVATLDVVAGNDFDGVFARIGDTIEIVGQILSVREGVGKRGRGRGVPYAFINFGPWEEQSVTAAFRSLGLNSPTNYPNRSWEGGWISVTGSVDPPRDGVHHGKRYRSVGITVLMGEQLAQISREEAKRRLARAGHTTTGEASWMNCDPDVEGRS